MLSFQLVFCFFKQKTAYEMRISDWSSDVCSSDLRLRARDVAILKGIEQHEHQPLVVAEVTAAAAAHVDLARRADRDQRHDIVRRPVSFGHAKEIGRASCRERVCQYV